jgi:hypothetical protein
MKSVHDIASGYARGSEFACGRRRAPQNGESQ